MIKVQQRDQFDEQFMSVDLQNPSFIKFAEAFGAHGKLVTSPEELGIVLEDALKADKPTIIEIPWSWTWGNEV